MPAAHRTQIFQVSTLYGAATLAAALDAGSFPSAHRRLLLVSNNAAIPETAADLATQPGFERLRGRFDRVLSWNETISPFHPGGWAPRLDDVPLWERHLRLLWDLGDDDVELIVESVQVNPALALTQLFPDSPVDVYADGLMSYGPTRDRIDPLVGTRIRRLLHLDLVPGLRPLLLTEFGVQQETVPTAAFRSVLAELAASDVEFLPAMDAPALLLGQYLSALGILEPEEEERLHVRMLRGAAARGHRDIVFKPHPTAPERWSRLLEREAEALGVRLAVLDRPVLAEVLFQRMRPALVVGCFSTALLTASTFFGLDVARTGTATLLERLSPYQNSNRVPVTIVDELLPDLEDAAAATDRRPSPVRAEADGRLASLIAAVGFAMQPQIHPDLRPQAERFLAAHLDAHTWRYFKRRRLTSLGLPGGVPSRLAFLSRNSTVRRVARRARAVQRRLARKRAAAR